MRLKFTNIAIIKEADIELSGLTVIAGKNDSGKSTVGKVLYTLIKSISLSNIIKTSKENNLQKSEFNEYINSIFKNQISEDANIEFSYNDTTFDIKILNDRCEEFHVPSSYMNDDLGKYRPIFIETPFIWSIFATLKTINNLEARGNEVEFNISSVIQDLYFMLMQNIKTKDTTIKLDIKNIINGEFVENNLGDYSFKKGEKNIDLTNTAMGIKYFGLLQVLSKNNHFYKGQILILDEPEVHLHPSWQLELAKIIVELVANGVIVLVNSHSPYMIEALERYAKRRGIKNNFYLSDDGKIIKDDDSLSKIFEKLSEPFREFDKMDSEIFNG